MKKLYAVVAALAITLPLVDLLRHQAQKSHARELQACTEQLEKIRADAAEFPSTDLYPFQEYRWTYDWVSNFEDGLAMFYGVREGRKQKGFVDFNNNIILEYYDPVKVETIAVFFGFENGHTEIFVYEHDSVPWGFLLPYGNPVPRVQGKLDCTSQETRATSA
ncbi:MAG: hypothetical protein AAFO84_04555 [Cyanobacteria bacterium J06598_1]